MNLDRGETEGCLWDKKWKMKPKAKKYAKKIFNPSNEKTKLSFTLVPTSTKSKISKAFHKWLYDCFTSFKSEFFEDNIIDITIIPSKAEMIT